MRQWLLVCLALAASAITMSFVVLHNFGQDEETKQNELQAALIAFACTFLAQSKSVLWVYLKSALKPRCNRVSIGLIHVAMSIICVSLFDFRIIHVASRDSKMMRTSILFADLSSLLLAEGQI